MSETKELLEELDRKVSNLISELKEIKIESDKKDQEIELLKNRLREQETTVQTLESENAALKLAQPKEEQEELKFKIGEMVKEIDRCISLLKV